MAGSGQGPASRHRPTHSPRILHGLAEFAATGEGDVKRFQNIEPPEFRLRVGDYRVRFHDYGHTLYVTAVRHRREAYR